MTKKWETILIGQSYVDKKVGKDFLLMQKHLRNQSSNKKCS